MSTYKVTMRCVVTKIVTCENCTQEQAETNPWDYATDEREVEQVDWEVQNVEEE